MEFVFAGFGGQGVLTSGLVMANIALEQGNRVLWSPAYGGAMRGGRSFSLVKFSTEEICEPLITALDVAVIMNQPSLSFLEQLKPDGLALVNGDVVDESVEIKTAAKVIKIPFNTLAAQSCGRSASANIVSIGALIRATNIFRKEDAVSAMCSFFEKKGKGGFNEGNRKAFEAGYSCLEQLS